MALRVEVGGTDRTTGAGVRYQSIKIHRGLEETGSCTLTLQSKDASWSPSLFDTLEIWEPVRRVTDAAITSGTLTLTSASASFVAGDVGTQVSVAGAGAAGAKLKTTIASVTNSTTVELAAQASTTVSGAVLLIGTCRFIGTLVDLPKGRIASIPNTLQFTAKAEDITGALHRLYPRASCSAEPLLTRIASLVDTTGADDYGITVYTVQAAVPKTFEDSTSFEFEDGGSYQFETQQDLGETVAAKTYDGRSTLAHVLNDLVTESNTSRSWQVDTLGRIKVLLPSTLATPQTLTSAHLQASAQPKMRYLVDDYANRIVYHYGADLSAYVTAESTSELTAMGNRAIEYQIDDTSANATTAASRATTQLAQRATRSRYVFEGLRTHVDGFEPGQFGGITVSEYSVSGTHLIQSVDAEYMELPAGHSWHFALVATNADVRATRWRDYLASILR